MYLQNYTVEKKGRKITLNQTQNYSKKQNSLKPDQDLFIKINWHKTILELIKSLL